MLRSVHISVDMVSFFTLVLAPMLVFLILITFFPLKIIFSLRSLCYFVANPSGASLDAVFCVLIHIIKVLGCLPLFPQQCSFLFMTFACTQRNRATNLYFRVKISSRGEFMNEFFRVTDFDFYQIFWRRK